VNGIAHDQALVARVMRLELGIGMLEMLAVETQRLYSGAVMLIGE